MDEFTKKKVRRAIKAKPELPVKLVIQIIRMGQRRELSKANMISRP